MSLEINNILLSAETSFLPNLNLRREERGLLLKNLPGTLGANFGTMGKFPTFVAGDFRQHGIPSLFRRILRHLAQWVRRPIGYLARSAVRVTGGRKRSARSLLFRAGAGAAGKDGSFPRIVSNRGI